MQRALEKYPFLLALDHLSGPSRVVTGLIEDLSYFDRTPVIFGAQTPHMEDFGALQPMCAGKSERLVLKEFPPPIALEFGRCETRRTDLWASNLDEVLRSLVDWGKGSPGSVAQMVKMAHFPRCWLGDRIKARVLCLDYRMGRREQLKLRHRIALVSGRRRLLKLKGEATEYGPPLSRQRGVERRSKRSHETSLR